MKSNLEETFQTPTPSIKPETFRLAGKHFTTVLCSLREKGFIEINVLF